MYTIDYFINRFSSIPEEKIICNRFTDHDGGHCANGWLGVRSISKPTEESIAIYEILKDVQLTTRCVYYDTDSKMISDSGRDYSNKLACVNNGDCLEYQQDTPKQRILALLNDVKNDTVPLSTESPKVLCSWSINGSIMTIEHVQQYQKPVIVEPKITHIAEASVEEKVPASTFVEKLLNGIFGKKVKESKYIDTPRKTEQRRLESQWID